MKEWELLSEKVAYNGKYRQITTRTFKLPNGFIGDYDVTTFGGGGTVGVAVLALTDDKKVVSFQQFRAGPMKLLYELPGGAIEKGEDPLQAVARELKEETGYEADLEYVGSYYRDAYMAGTWHMVIGRHAKRISDTAHEDGEYGEVILLTLDEFKEKLFAGEMTDTTLGYAGLLRLGLL